jgi:hypothetical protein
MKRIILFLAIAITTIMHADAIMRHVTTASVTPEIFGGLAILPGVDAETFDGISVINIEASDHVFKLKTPTIDDLEFDLPATVIYDGKANPLVVMPKNGVKGLGIITVKYNNCTSSPVDAGRYVITASIAESAVYSATTIDLELPGDYEIVKDINGAGIFIDAIRSMTYTGSPVTPVFNVIDNSTILVNGVDYTTVFINNVYAGTATVTVTGEGNYIGVRSATFTIAATVPVITTTSLPGGTVGLAYNQILQCANGGEPVVWSIPANSALPEGLQLDASTGRISGEPTDVCAVAFIVEATNSGGTVSQILHITVTDDVPPVITIYGQKFDAISGKGTAHDPIIGKVRVPVNRNALHYYDVRVVDDVVEVMFCSSGDCMESLSPMHVVDLSQSETVDVCFTVRTSGGKLYHYALIFTRSHAIPQPAESPVAAENAVVISL